MDSKGGAPTSFASAFNYPPEVLEAAITEPPGDTSGPSSAGGVSGVPQRKFQCEFCQHQCTSMNSMIRHEAREHALRFEDVKNGKRRSAMPQDKLVKWYASRTQALRASSGHVMCVRCFKPQADLARHFSRKESISSQDCREFDSKYREGLACFTCMKVCNSSADLSAHMSTAHGDSATATSAPQAGPKRRKREKKHCHKCGAFIITHSRHVKTCQVPRTPTVPSEEHKERIHQPQVVALTTRRGADIADVTCFVKTSSRGGRPFRCNVKLNLSDDTVGATCDANPCQLKQKLVRTQRLCGHKINPKGCKHAEVAESYVSKNATRIVKQWAAQRGKHYGDMREAVKQTCELFDVEHALELVDAAEASRSAVVSGAPGSRVAFEHFSVICSESNHHTGCGRVNVQIVDGSLRCRCNKFEACRHCVHIGLVVAYRSTLRSDLVAECSIGVPSINSDGLDLDERTATQSRDARVRYAHKLYDGNLQTCTWPADHYPTVLNTTRETCHHTCGGALVHKDAGKQEAKLFGLEWVKDITINVKQCSKCSAVYMPESDQIYVFNSQTAHTVNLMRRWRFLVMDGTPLGTCVNAARQATSEHQRKKWGKDQRHRDAWGSYASQVDNSLSSMMERAGLVEPKDMATTQFPFFCIQCGYHPVAVFFDACGKSYARLRGQVLKIYDDEERKVSQRKFWGRVTKAAIGATSITPLCHNEICSFVSPLCGDSDEVVNEARGRPVIKNLDAAVQRMSVHYSDWKVKDVVECRNKTKAQLDGVLQKLGISTTANNTRAKSLSAIETVYNKLHECMDKNFSKVYVSGANTKSGGIMDMFCPHGVCLGFKVLIGPERPSDVLELLMRLKTIPNVVLYDSWCTMLAKMYRAFLKRGIELDNRQGGVILPASPSVLSHTAVSEEMLTQAKLPDLKKWCKERNIKVYGKGARKKQELVADLREYIRRMGPHSFDDQASSGAAAVGSPVTAEDVATSHVPVGSSPPVTADVDAATSHAPGGSSPPVTADVDAATSHAPVGSSPPVSADVDAAMPHPLTPAKGSSVRTATTATQKPELASIPGLSILTGYKSIDANNVCPDVKREPHPVTKEKSMLCLHDRLHCKNHRNCHHRSVDLVAQLRPLNSGVSEQRNSTRKKYDGHLSQMGLGTYMQMNRLVRHYQNQEINRKALEALLELLEELRAEGDYCIGVNEHGMWIVKPANSAPDSDPESTEPAVQRPQGLVPVLAQVVPDKKRGPVPVLAQVVPDKKRGPVAQVVHDKKPIATNTTMGNTVVAVGCNGDHVADHSSQTGNRKHPSSDTGTRSSSKKQKCQKRLPDLVGPSDVTNPFIVVNSVDAQQKPSVPPPSSSALSTVNFPPLSLSSRGGRQLPQGTNNIVGTAGSGTHPPLPQLLSNAQPAMQIVITGPPDLALRVDEVVGSQPQSTVTSAPQARAVSVTSRTRADGYTRSGVGLPNRGNTCFINAVIQCLCSCPALQACLGSMVLPMKPPEERYPALAYHSVLLFQRMVLENGPATPVSPDSLLGAVGALDSRFADNTQQDAHDFLRFFIGAVSEGLLAAFSVTRWTEAFQGALQCTTTCQRCNYDSIKRDPLLDLSVPVPTSRQVCTLQACFKQFARHGRIKDYDCEKCKVRTVSTQHLSVSKFPDVLVVHLKRFTSNAHMGRVKINTLVSVPEYLDAQTLRVLGQCDSNTRYQLVGNVVHHGRGLGGGHYTATARLTPLDNETVALSKSKPSDSRSPVWASYDDNSVCIRCVGGSKRAGVGGILPSAMFLPALGRPYDVLGLPYCR